MRAKVFRWLLKRLKIRTPDIVRLIEIQLLYNSAAKAFGAKKRSIWPCRPAKALRRYAEFTSEYAKASGDFTERLFTETYKLGNAVRRITGLRDKKDLEDLVCWLYSNIGIQMEAELPGEVTVHECYFDRFYTPEQCSVMSSSDSGAISGICGGGKLEFTERITEGCRYCRANFTI